jgi:ABC-type lipoprotein release transport system permease subunit
MKKTFLRKSRKKKIIQTILGVAFVGIFIGLFFLGIFLYSSLIFGDKVVFLFSSNTSQK